MCFLLGNTFVLRTMRVQTTLCDYGIPNSLGLLVRHEKKTNRGENMAELKERFLPKERISDGIVFEVVEYTEHQGKFGEEYHLKVTTENPIDGNNEFLVSLWQIHVRKYVKDVLKRKHFEGTDFVGKKFSIASKKFLGKDGNERFSFTELNFVSDTDYQHNLLKVE